MLVFFVCMLAGYFILIVLLIAGWKKAMYRHQLQVVVNENELITVIIPVRNEEKNISLLLHDLTKQTDSTFEIIVVDDHSEDDTVDIVLKLIKAGFHRLTLVRLTDDQGKKNAITKGVRQASGSIIVTTDADCRVSENWVSSMRQSFADPTVKLVFGGVRIRQEESTWSSVQAMEFASLIASGVASNALGYPTMCNGANLAYRKEVFEMVDGYAGNLHVPSGDDEFLLQKINAKFPGSVKFINDQKNVIETAGVSISDFVHQRVRWAGKWSQQHLTSKALALYIFLFHFFWLVMIAWFIIHNNFIFLLSLFTVKFLLEFILLRKVMRFLNSSWNWSAFIMLQLTYSLYAVFFGMAAHIKSPEWKGRKIRSLVYK